MTDPNVHNTQGVPDEEGEADTTSGGAPDDPETSRSSSDAEARLHDDEAED